MTALNIKNNEAYRLAREIARLTGDSLTGAVISALRAQRNALKSEVEPADLRVDRLLGYGRRFSGHGHSSHVDKDLFDDELGLPS